MNIDITSFQTKIINAFSWRNVFLLRFYRSVFLRVKLRKVGLTPKPMMTYFTGTYMRRKMQRLGNHNLSNIHSPLYQYRRRPLVVFDSWGTSMWPYRLSIGSHWHPHPWKLPWPDRSITNRIWADCSRRLDRLRDASLSSLIDGFPWGSNIMKNIYRSPCFI